MDIKIGIIGLGSIGIRHANELVELGVKKIYALRTNKGSKKLPKHLAEFITNIDNKEDFLNQEIDGYIISNPTSLHIDTINFVSKKNKPVFIEKPLCENQSDIQNLINFSGELAQVGFCLRFHVFFRTIKNLIHENKIGEIYHSRINVGQYLPSWHPYTDYRSEYFSRKDLGGGALRTLSHEIDLCLYFFGSPISSKTLTGKVSNLEINVDDYALILLTYHNHISRIEIDFFNKKTERKGILFGTKGDLHYDFFKNKIVIYNTEGEIIYSENIKQNNMYNEQMKSFLNFILTSKNKEGSTWKENIEIMKIIENEKSI